MQQTIAFLRGLFVTAASLAIILLVNFLQMLTIPLFLLCHPMGRSVNERLAVLWSASFSFLLRKILKVSVTFSGDPPVPGENAFVIANHQGMVDIPVLFLLAREAKMLRFVKWFVKDPIKYCPGVGWGMLFLDCVFLKRDWAKDRKRIDTTFVHLRHPSARFWLISFPEGTRFTEAKHRKAVEFAKNRGLPVPEHTLIPRPRGFSSTLLGLSEKLDAVYDVTLKFSGTLPGLLGFFFRPQTPIEALVRRYPKDKIPSSEQDQAQWLKARFREKDQLLRS